MDHDPAKIDLLPWSSGPPLDEKLKAEVRRVFEDLRRYLPLPELPTNLDHAAATASVEVAWSSVRDKSSPAAADGSGPNLYDLHLLDHTLSQLSIDRAGEANDALALVIGRLESATCSVSDLIRLIPQLICDLGFSRGLISRVDDDVWTPELMYVVGDPQWSVELTEIGQAQPQLLNPGLFETELVSTQQAIIARNVQAEPWRSHAGLAPASQTRSYVAAPIVSDGEVVGILHAERFGQRRDVDEMDRQMLVIFAKAAQLALSRAALVEELQSVHQRITTAARSVDRAVGGVHRVPLLRLTRTPGEGSDGLVIRSGPAPGTAWPLPSSLSRRELEVLALIASGKTNATIARKLNIAEGTVKQHVKHILRKLLVGTRSEAVTRWFQAGGDAGS